LRFSENGHGVIALVEEYGINELKQMIEITRQAEA
jgi:hypothetical protein